MADGPTLGTKVNRGVAWAATAQAVIAISDLVSQMVVVALLITSDDFGIASAAMAFYVMLDYAADFGVTSAIIQRDDHTDERVSTVFWFNLLVSAGLFVLLLGLGPLYGWIQSNATIGWLLVAYGGKLLFQNVYAIPFALLRRELRFGEIAKARIVAHLAESIGRIVFAYLGAAVWCWTLAALTRAVVFGIIVQARHPFIPKLVFQPREIIPYVRFGMRTAASQILYQLYTNLDYAVVLYFFGKTANGIYALAYFIVLEPVKTIANVVIDVAFPTFARLAHDRPALIKQFLQFTRLNIIAVLPFVVLILLVIPEFLQIFYSGGKWTDQELALCADAARILCIVGMLRALGFLGPPLLDGIGRPELTLRYMTFAALAVPGMFLLGAQALGGAFGPSDPYGLLSVAVAWAVGYPLAFAVLSYLVVRSIDLPVRDYLRASWGMIGCCVAGGLAGLAVSLAIRDQSAVTRLLAIGITAILVMAVLVAKWQKITPRSIKASLM
ncbi:MAG TPA: oligosaccharide flippase family protein [Kofleriaceae bacterium]|nr:oligosaccharide flippase family protein [Kofleriaceae bacterium]